MHHSPSRILVTAVLMSWYTVRYTLFGFSVKKHISSKLIRVVTGGDLL